MLVWLPKSGVEVLKMSSQCSGGGAQGPRLYLHFGHRQLQDCSILCVATHGAQGEKSIKLDCVIRRDA